MLVHSRASAFYRVVDLHAERTPFAPAVISDYEQLTYGELVARANRLAHRLIEAGARPQSLIGLCVERSVHMYVGILAILKAGAAYVPLDPAYPGDRIALMVEDCRANLIVTQTSVADVLPQTDARFILLDAEEGDDAAAHAPAVPYEDSHLAYVIYTSGSTGRPKGVMIENGSLAAFAAWTTERFTPEQTRRVLASSSLSFDVSVFEYTMALSSGGALVVVRNALDLLLQPPREPVSAIVSVPSPIAELVRAKAVPPSVNTLILGGEALTHTLATEIYATTKVEELINAWGVTEDTIATTLYTVPRDLERDPPIGDAISGRGIHLLDENLQPVAVGTPGEICCSGNGVARGYLNRSDVTAQRFVANPFGDSERLYRSGDLAVANEAGEIRFIGRTDMQVKVRGYRIELGEIETTLAEHPNIAQVAVLAKTIAGNTSLAMYAVERRKNMLTLPEIERYLSDKLPNHMIPSTLSVLDAMPLGPTGKTDRKALQIMVRDRPGLAQHFVASRTLIETRIAELFASLLGLATIGVDDNFFALGGQSLLAARAIAEIIALFPQESELLQARFGERFLLTEFWRLPTIACIAAALEQRPVRHEDISPVEDVRCLQAGKPDRTPLFFLHGVIDGEAFYTWNLANALGPDQPLYTLAPHGRNRREVPRTIELMAADYLAKIRHIAPHGPYRFAGYCNGGLVCFEMARMLQAEGETVERLILIGVPGHNVSYRVLEAAVECLRFIPGIRRELRRSVFLKIRGRFVALARWRRHLRGEIMPEESVVNPRPKDPDQQTRSEALYLAIDTYVPKAYAGSATLLVGNDDLYAKVYRPFRDWAKVVRDFTPVTVPGDHHFVEEHPEILGEYIR